MKFRVNIIARSQFANFNFLQLVITKCEMDGFKLLEWH